jgi:DnaJ-class molecular chaperone
MSNNNSPVSTDINYQKVISNFQSELGALTNKVAPNKKLSESRLRLAAIVALPTSVETEITLKEALNGTTRSFVMKDQIACTSCVNSKPINRLHCPECKGLGYTLSERQIEVPLEAGLSTGQEVRYPTLGALDVRSGKNGDLIVKIKMSEHPYFKIEGKNITSTLNVSLYEATLGGKVEVPTATGKVIMNLAPLTQTGAVYRLKGLGIAGGDQLLTIEINMPKKLSQEQIQLFQKIKQLADETNTQANLVYLT